MKMMILKLFQIYYLENEKRNGVKSFANEEIESMEN
jgi:hypothetical protein